MHCMRQPNLLSFRTALLAGLGILHGCGARTGDTDTGRTNDTAQPANGADAAPPNQPPGPQGDAAVGSADDPSVPDPAVTNPAPPATTPTATATVTPVPTTPGTVIVNPGPTVTAPTTPVTTPPPATTPNVDPPPMMLSGLQECAAAQPLGDGLAECENGLVIRVAQPTCANDTPRDGKLELLFPPKADAGVPDASTSVPETLPYSNYVESTNTNYTYTCDEDADCTELPYGYCNFSSDSFSGQSYQSYCAYGCVEDADCGAGMVCECGSPTGMCIPATCQTGSDCGAENACARYAFNNGCGTTEGYVCATAQSECHVAADCGANFTGCEAIEGELRCSTESCAIGRPFLVQGEVRKAAVTLRDDWSGPWTLDTVRAPAEQGAPGRENFRSPTLDLLAAAEWAAIGQMEHASIAAFARFALQLLAVGAPPELLHATSQAMADETRHARLAFALASRFGGRALGPAVLDVRHSLDDDNLKSIAICTLLEGCIGETVAALEAKMALQYVQDDEARNVLEQVARDEADHALLAWQFVQWALGTRPELVAELTQRAERELAKAVSESTLSHTPDSQALLAYGLVGPAARVELRAAALKDVVLPCLSALTAAVASSAHAQSAASRNVLDHDLEAQGNQHQTAKGVEPLA
jgi:hypothetical protein